MNQSTGTGVNTGLVAAIVAVATIGGFLSATTAARSMAPRTD
jgi:hypothetical protein